MTVYDDDFRELIEDARDAVRDLLAASEQDSLMYLRCGYGELRTALEQDDRAREREAKLADRRGGDHVWRQTPAERRESLLLNALGDRRLTIRELTARLNTELGYPYPSDDERSPAVYESHVRSLLTRMQRAGQLERAPEPFKGNVRYRWFRKQALDGPIVDLERAYHDDEAVA